MRSHGSIKQFLYQTYYVILNIGVIICFEVNHFEVLLGREGRLCAASVQARSGIFLAAATLHFSLPGGLV